MRSLQSFDLQISRQNHICKLVQVDLSIFVFVALFKELEDLALWANFVQYSLHIFKADISFAVFVVEREHLSESSEAGFGQDSFFAVVLSAIGSASLFEVEAGGVLIAPAIDGWEVEGHKIGVYFHHQLFEGDSSILILI